MRWQIILPVLFVLSVSGTLAATLEEQPIRKMDIDFFIMDNNSVEKLMDMTFTRPLNTTLNFTISANVTVINVTDGTNALAFNITGDSLEIYPIEPISGLVLDYVTVDKIYQRENVNFFFSELKFSSIARLNARAILPEGNIIHDNQYTPSGAKIRTDGRQIILEWAASKPEGNIVYSVEFESMNKESPKTWFETIINTILFATSIILSGIIIIGAVFFTKKTKREFLRGFRNDDKKVVEFLQKNKSVWQNQLQHEFSLSRAGTTRLVKRLESRGLIKKEPYGRTNKIHWLK